MHTGVISFCDRINCNIKSDDTKDEILRDLLKRFQIQILQKHWYHLDENNCSHLQRIPHLACIRSNGNPYYMYFTKYEDIPIIYFIDKKVHPGYQKPRIIIGRGLWSKELFDNTLIEGEMVKDIFNGWLFLINDVIVYRNKVLSNEYLPKRLEYAFNILENMHTPDPIIDVCKYKVKQFSHATQEGTLELIELSKKLPYTSRGIYYWPFSPKFKPKLYNFNENIIVSVQRTVKDNPNFKERDVNSIVSTVSQRTTSPIQISNTDTEHISTSTSIPSALDKNNTAILWLRKTELPDVYDVYSSDHGMIKNTKIGIAYIPSFNVSKMLRAIFKDTTVAMYIPFECKYQESVDKWMPLKKYN